jgi:hypothetical protein
MMTVSIRPMDPGYRRRATGKGCSRCRAIAMGAHRRPRSRRQPQPARNRRAAAPDQLTDSVDNSAEKTPSDKQTKRVWGMHKNCAFLLFY